MIIYPREKAVSSETPTPEEGTVMTFYSYKGGTGRSMALANVACLLASRCTGNESVLAIDWDLEAPGLHRFFADPFAQRPVEGDEFTRQLSQGEGLIDLFSRLDEESRHLAGKDEETRRAATEELVASIEWQRYILPTGIASLSLLKAGRFDEADGNPDAVPYSARVNQFRWDLLYERCPWLFRQISETLAERHRYVLVDSRTGLTDISGICTMLLPEKLVVVFTPNRQSLTGVENLVRRATNYRRASDDLRPLVVYPLPSRLDNGEPERKAAWRMGSKDGRIAGYQGVLEGLFKEAYKLETCSLQRYLDEVPIPHMPRYAYGEEIAILLEQSSDALSLPRSYERFTEWLTEKPAPWETAGDDVAQLTPELRDLIKGAERAYVQLTPEERDVARRALTRLVRIPGRREVFQASLLRHPIADLGAGAEPILRKFVDAGVLVVERAALSAGSEIESANAASLGLETVTFKDAALITGWPQLAEWIERDRDFLRWRQEVGERTAQWLAARRSPDFLLRGGEIALARAYYPRRNADLTTHEQTYVKDSISAGASQRLETIGRRVGVAALVLILFGILGNGMYERYVRRPRAIAAAAERSRDPLEAVLLLSEITGPYVPPRADKLATELVRTTLPVAVLRSPVGPVSIINFSPDGRHLIATGGDSRVFLWPATGASQPQALEAPSGSGRILDAAAFEEPLGSEGGPREEVRALLSDGVFASWSRGSNALTKPLALKDSRLQAHFSPNGATAAVTGTNGVTLVRFPYSDRVELTPVFSGSALDAIPTDDGARVAIVAGDGKIRLWDMRDRLQDNPIGTLDGRQLDGLAITESGSKLITVVGSQVSGVAELWALDPPARRIGSFGGPQLFATSAALNRDGSLALIGLGDGTAEVWDSLVSRKIGVVKGHSGAIIATAFSPKGGTFATASTDSTIRVWRLSQGVDTLKDWKQRIAYLRSSVTACLSVPHRMRLMPWEDRRAASDANKGCLSEVGAGADTSGS